MIQLNAGFLADVSAAMGLAFVDAILCRDNKATVNQTEFTALRGIKDLVRLGRLGRLGLLGLLGLVLGRLG